jgi:hypothetical protein
MTTAKALGFALLIVCVQCIGAEAKCSMANFEGFDQAVDARMLLSSGAHCTVVLKYPQARPTGSILSSRHPIGPFLWATTALPIARARDT